MGTFLFVYITLTLGAIILDVIVRWFQNDYPWNHSQTKPWFTGQDIINLFRKKPIENSQNSEVD